MTTPHAVLASCLVLIAGVANGCRRQSEAPAGESPPATTKAIAEQEQEQEQAAPKPSSSAPASAQAQARETTPRMPVPKAVEELTNAFTSAAAAIRGAVVRVDVEVGRQGGSGFARGEGGGIERFFRDPFGQSPFNQQPQRGVGSGFLIDDRGHVVTNSHVVERASHVTVRLADARQFEARVVGRDPLTDIAVLELAKAPGDLTVARLGKAETLRVGEWVLAVGSPLGLPQSVTAGIVSSLGRTGGQLRMSGERVQRYIQTDASINPGNSGGPLITLAGEVVGVNTLINVGPGGAYGFAIPIEQAAEVARALIKDGRMRYPYLGVQIGSLEDLPPEVLQRLGDKAPREGALVSGVVPDGPAARAGLRDGDIIVTVDKEPIKDASGLIDAISRHGIGRKVSVEAWREGQRRTIEVTIGELDSDREPAAGGGTARIGIGLATLNDELAPSLGLPAGTRGAIVTEVQPGGPAARAGLQSGDVIVEIDGKAVTSAEDVARSIREGGRKQRLLKVRSAAGTRLVTITPEP
jgi:serine protease Do